MLRGVDSAPASAKAADRQRLLFASYHCYLDPSSGAAIATHFRQDGVPATIFSPSRRGSSMPSWEEGKVFLALLERVLDGFRPGILLTYGGHWLAGETMRCGRQREIAVVFALHNFEYHDARLFEPVNSVLVPSRFCGNPYRRTLGLECTA